MKRTLVVAALVAGVSAVYIFRLDAAAGLFVDDAWYIVLAKSLVEGEGFRLISSATTPILPAFPPGFPMILAPVLAVAPNFPDNVAALKAVSIVAMFGVAAAIYFHLVRQRSVPTPVATVVALIAALMPAFVFLATSTVMAEAVFTLGQLCVVLSVERAARAPAKDATRGAIVGGLIAGVTLLVRLAGIAGVVASALYLWQRRGWRAGLVFAAVAAMCYVPWAAYAAANRHSDEEHVRHGGSVAYSYRDLLLMRYGGEAHAGLVTWAELPGRISANLLNVAGRDIGAFILPAAYRGSSESGQEVFGMSGETGIRASSMGGVTATVAVSLAVSAVAFVGFLAAARQRFTVAEAIVPLTLAMVVLVPARTFRYVLPLAPFVVFYFFCGLEVLSAAIARSREWRFGATFRIAAACILAFFAAEHTAYVRSMKSATPPTWLKEQAEIKTVTDWLASNLKGPGSVASNNPGLVYLATGRKGLSMGNARENWQSWQRSGIRYGVALHPADKPDDSLPYQALYQSSDRRRWVVELPPAVDRK
jgi:hypothetical protein